MWEMDKETCNYNSATKDLCVAEGHARAWQGIEQGHLTQPCWGRCPEGGDSGAEFDDPV